MIPKQLTIVTLQRICETEEDKVPKISAIPLGTFDSDKVLYSLVLCVNTVKKTNMGLI